MTQYADSAAVAVTFQALNALLFAFVMTQIGRIFRFRYARLWSVAWLSLAIAIAAVRVWMYSPHSFYWIVYLIADWTFLFLLWAGCREFVGAHQLRLRVAVLLSPIAAAVALVMIRFSNSFNDLFTMQAGIIAMGTAISWLTLRRQPTEERTMSWRMMRVALASVTLLYAAYVPIYARHEHIRSVPFLEYASLVDLLAGVFLGLSMILLTAEAEQQQLQGTVAALDLARSQAEQRLHVDPLTEVLNRYAFHAMQRGDEIATEGVLSGVVAVFDIDNLKVINDQHGHASGDIAIRAAATAIRNLVRAEDLLFRWGGDEFVVILPNFSMKQLHGRLTKLEDGIPAQAESGANIKFNLSWGDAEFGAERSLGDAIRQADAKMYESRRNR